MSVVVREVGIEDRGEVVVAEDQDPVGAFAPEVPIQRSAKAFARGARIGVRMIVICSAVNTVSKPVTNLVSRSRIRKRSCSSRSSRSISRLRACWVTHDPVGAELVIHGGDLRRRWAVAVGHDRRPWRYDCCI